MLKTAIGDLEKGEVVMLADTGELATVVRVLADGRLWVRVREASAKREINTDEVIGLLEAMGCK